MFKTATSNKRSAETRSRILHTALATFRQHGLGSATMRQISKEAGVALGAAYYYFPSKEAIVQAFFDTVQEEHHQRLNAALSESLSADLEARLRIAFHTKLDILQSDRHLLGSLFRYTGEPDHPLSTLGPGTRPNRDRSIAAFAFAIGDEKLPDDIRALLPTALWALHMGILLYFIYDASPNQERTRKLVDGVLSLVVRLLALVKFPLLKPFRGSLFALLSDAGLFPNSPFSEPRSAASIVLQEE